MKATLMYEFLGFSYWEWLEQKERWCRIHKRLEWREKLVYHRIGHWFEIVWCKSMR